MCARAKHAFGAFEASRLEVCWQNRAKNIFENLRVIVRQPRNALELHAGEPFFHLHVAPAHRPGWQLAGSFVFHAFLLLAILATSRTGPSPAQTAPPPEEVQITWYGPARDIVPKVAPRPKRTPLKAQARRERSHRQIATRGYNPNITVVFQPPRATNRRQLLIHPQAAPQLAKSLPAMPNIIQWANSAPAGPAIGIHANQLRALRGKDSEQAQLRAPRITYQTPHGPMDVLRSPNESVAPPTSVAPKAIRGVRAASAGESAEAAPTLGGVAPAGSSRLAIAEGTGETPGPPLPGALGAIRATRAASAGESAEAAPTLGGVAPAGSSRLAIAGGTGETPGPPLPGALGAIRATRAASAGESAEAAPTLGGVAPAGSSRLAIAGGTGETPGPPLPGALGAIRATRAASPHVAAQGSPSVGAGSLGASTIYLPAGSDAVPLPPLPSAPNAIRPRGSNGSGSSMAAPNVGHPADELVSLSLSPGTNPPPPGNAYAPMSIGPHPGNKSLPAAPNLVGSGASGKVPGFPAPEGSATGPEGLLILHNGNPPAPPPVPQPVAATLRKPARVAPKPVAAAIARRPPAAPRPGNPKSGRARSGFLPGPISVAHNVLLVGVVRQNLANRTIGPWSMPTLAMNLPKLSNSRGAWVLDFASPMPAALRGQNELIVPLPNRAAEPPYPAALQQEGVYGKVVLRAVIESNGRVSQIRVTESLNPALDHLAEVAFSRWRFDPALLNDKPIAMPVIVTVPFHYVPAPH